MRAKAEECRNWMDCMWNDLRILHFRATASADALLEEDDDDGDKKS